MKWNEKRVGDWTGFTKRLEQLGITLPAGESLVFRGQSDATWKLIPKLCRELREGLSAEDVIKLEGSTKREFQSQAHLHLSTNVIPQERVSVLNWWFLMQHHNAPTRLLDWSASPYVAAYFAVVENWDSDGVIWCFDHQLLDHYMTERIGDLFTTAVPSNIDKLLEKPDAKEMLFTLTRQTKNDRMVAQQGVSTLCTNVFADHAEVIATSFTGSEEAYRCLKLIIPSELKQSFLQQLRAMNITANSLFPGIDGLGRSVEEMARLSLADKSK